MKTTNWLVVCAALLLAGICQSQAQGTYPDRPVPYARVLEQQLLPTKDKVLAAARELLAY